MTMAVSSASARILGLCVVVALSASAIEAQRGATRAAVLPRELWRVPGAGHGRPAVADGVVYMLSAQHEVVALDTRDGKTLWRQRTNESGAATAGSAVVIAGDAVIAGDYDIVAFDRSTGAPQWRFVPALGYGPGIYLAEGSGRRLFAGSPSGRLYAIDVGSGKQIWSAAVQGAAAVTVFQPVSDDLVVGAGYTIFTAPNVGGVAMFEAATGRELWRTPFPKAADPLLGTGLGGGTILTANELVAVSGDGTIYGFARTDGRIRWSIPGVAFTPSAVQGPMSEPPTTSGADYRPLVRIDETLVAGSLKGVVVAYDLRTHRERWRYVDPRSGSVSFGIGADNRTVYVPFASGRHVAIDLRTGIERWRTGDPRDGFNWPAAADALRLYLAGGEAYVAFAR
jgi:outer membrane protein assembly factor BamB